MTTVTVKEAKTKWYPMERVGYESEFEHMTNAGYSHNKNSRCKANQCMMWRSNGIVPYDIGSDNFDENPGPGWEWDEEKWIFPHPEKVRGYCGLAGRFAK